MPTSKGSEAPLSCVQCFLYLVSSSINVSIVHITCLDTFWTDLLTHSVDLGWAVNVLDRGVRIVVKSETKPK